MPQLAITQLARHIYCEYMGAYDVSVEAAL